jgi:hypothetical protein
MEFQDNIKELEQLNSELNLLYTKGINEENIEKIIKELFEMYDICDKTSYRFQDNSPNTAQFVPHLNQIVISIKQIPKWLYLNVDDPKNTIKVGNMDSLLLKCYLVLNMLVHETEHAKQYLIGQEELPSPSILVSKGYRNITELLINPNYILPRPIKLVRRTISLVLYYKKQNSYILERNANLEAFYKLSFLAQKRNDSDILSLFTEITELYLKLGYINSIKGSMYETHKEILMLDKFPKTKDYLLLDTGTKMRFGLPITEEDISLSKIL